jgi:hypothetical protein
MAEAQKSATSETKPAIKEGFQYVTIPPKNVHGWEFPSVAINLKRWGPGTHLVTNDEAGEINRILERYNREMIRLIAPHRDTLAAQKEREVF